MVFYAQITRIREAVVSQFIIKLIDVFHIQTILKMCWATNIIFVVEIYQLKIPKSVFELLFPVTSLWAPEIKKRT